MAFNLDVLSQDEGISRYITEKSKLRPGLGRPRYNAFMPPQNRRLSVCRSQDLSEVEVWGIGDEFVGTQQKPVIARADISVTDITRDFSAAPSPIAAEPLRVEPDFQPYPRHANVVNWPDDETIQRAIAVELANIANLVQR